MNSIYLTQEKELNSFIEHAVDGLTYHQDVSNHCPAKDLKQVLQQKNLFEEIRGPDDVQVYALQKGLESEMNKKLIRGIPVIKPGLTINYQAELNEQQLIAVTTTDRPVLIIAGAGSGKTRIITYKVAYLLESGVPANEILLLTFARKSAMEMIDRTQSLLSGEYASDVLGGTFHGFANHILRRYGRIIGVPNNFSIIDTADTADIMDLMKTELGMGKRPDGRPFPRKDKIQGVVSRGKNLELPIRQIIKKEYPEDIIFVEDIEKLKQAASKYKQASSLLDFDDLMLVLRDGLRDNQLFRRKVQGLFSHILVDEYQDVNRSQREIVELLSEKNGRLTVVGDDAQSIYAFRGAQFDNIILLPQRLPECGIVMIERNYRSTQEILAFCNDVIAGAKLGFKKQMRSDRTNGRKPQLQQFADGQHEAVHIVDAMLEIRQNDLEYKDFAVLTRSSWQSNHVQAELMKRGIPYVVYGGIKFGERRHVRDVMALLKITINPMDAVAWHRILKLIEGIGNVRAKQIIGHIHENKGEVDFSWISASKAIADLKRLQDVVNEVKDGNFSVHEILDKIVVFYQPILRQIEDNHQAREKDLEVLKTIAGKYDTLEELLADFTLEPPTNRYQDRTVPMTEPDEKPMVVSTIHSAKGLEWHTVFLPHVLDGLIPSIRNMDTLEELEEERRLFYVACTRARENLFISMPGYVDSYGGVFTKPTRFLFDVDPRHYKIIR
jgi:DNA helicase II / ATP-dependent DNA helicase PcrA